MPIAVVTGASSGIGRDIAIELAKRGYELILVSRRAEKLKELTKELPTRTEIVCADLSVEENCYSLYERCRDKDVEVLINNAGFGIFGDFCDIPKERETEMINLNVKAVHILTKLFLKDFKAADKGYILNVASAAGFMPEGALLSAYYATKAYVLSLSRSINTELKMAHSNVCVSVLCPGPVKTEFNAVAGVQFASGGLDSKKVAEIAVEGLFSGKKVIIPGALIKAGKVFSKVLPDNLLGAFAYRFQKGKQDRP